MLDTFTRETEISERKMLHCASCKRETIHMLEARCTGYWSIEDALVSGGSNYSIFRCGACDTVCYESAFWDSEDVDHDVDGQAYANVRRRQYPVPASAHFTFNTDYTPAHLNHILDEMLYALAGSQMILATIGLRLAVEYIVKDKKCAGRNLIQRIDSLRASGLIDEDQKVLLHRIRLRGNAGAHEAKGMNAKDIVMGMSIIEGLLEKLYNGPARYQATIKLAMEQFSEDPPSTTDTPSMPLI